MTENQWAHELLVQFKHGNIAAFESLYAHYAREFYRHAKNKGLTHEQAEDIAEEVFKNILNGGIDTYDEVKGNKSGGEGWLWTICNNQINAFYRRQGREVPIDDIPEYIFVSHKTDPSLLYESKEKKVARICAWWR